ncbi:hypothetical protein [Streptomyces sp. AN091965]|uniref:hypothetical protein n=1 Tax=Streptomyces sp. AN091965 TaxID=2927803 RepID=UPI001F604B46|nr:hypothetical protein [Streptomyces sp. AN091965]MCI3927869.1 hypothetical protein [Streptomyces sp. AN091965]
MFEGVRAYGELLPITEVGGLLVGSGEPGPAGTELVLACRRVVRGEKAGCSH